VRLGKLERKSIVNPKLNNKTIKIKLPFTPQIHKRSTFYSKMQESGGIVMTSAFFRSHSASFKVDSTSVRGDYASFKGDSDSLKVISHLSKINNKTIKEAFFYCKPIKDRSLIKKTEMKAFS